MRAVDIIAKKRDGISLSKAEIDYFISDYSKGMIPDYQASALMMAIYFSDMDMDETVAMTMAMVDSGDVIDLSSIDGIIVDKHSTGGVGDTTTLIAAPIAAACGLNVAKLSGKGLGHTGGTLDKLESIDGFNINLSRSEFINAVKKAGIAVAGQTGNLVPADKMLYALRDVTATVPSMPLIAASIMSKKIAAGADALVLDVKTGSGAFMQDYENAKILAETMVKVGSGAGIDTIAVITDMNQPLGDAVGNTLEVKEAVMILKGEKGSPRLREVSLLIAASMLILGGICSDMDDAQKMAEDAISKGSALSKFADMIENQDGDKSIIEDYNKLPSANKIISVTSDKEGYIQKIKTSDIGRASMLLGAGRAKKDDIIDPAVGLWMRTGLGSRIKSGDVMAEFHVNDEKQLDSAISLFKSAFTIGEDKPCDVPLVYNIIK